MISCSLLKDQSLVRIATLGFMTTLFPGFIVLEKVQG